MFLHSSFCSSRKYSQNNFQLFQYLCFILNPILQNILRWHHFPHWIDLVLTSGLYYFLGYVEDLSLCSFSLFLEALLCDWNYVLFESLVKLKPNYMWACLSKLLLGVQNGTTLLEGLRYLPNLPYIRMYTLIQQSPY